MSDSAQWQVLQELFDLGEKTPTGDRDRVLSEACADPELRRRALAILQAAEEESAAVETQPPMQTIGPYRLVRLIGSGGIGTVYLAERFAGGVLQRSALKMLSPHAAGDMFVERFEREQRILASLDHPHITRMQDAGLSAAGQPYLVMEYVDGVHIDGYCDVHRLSVEARLGLFLEICDAVAYAHRNLIVHLDLKPSNILVNQEGVVKLLDFGTSKLLALDGGLTSTRMATPAYGSPEQMRGEPVTTLCDVYSLGAVLFELLAGRRLNRDVSVAGMMESAAREQEAEKLESAVTLEAAEARGLTQTRLRARLGGDLATIVAKCLRPRPKDRYHSVNALVSDIRRHLEGRPVLARPQTAGYRAGKFLRRNGFQVAVAAVVLLTLMSVLGYAGWRQRQAYEEGQRALRMQTFLYSLFKLANSYRMGKPTATVPEFLQMGVDVLPQYIKDPRDLRQAQLALAESMFRNGDEPNALKPLEDVIRTARADGDKAAEAEAEAFAGTIQYRAGHTEEGRQLTERSLQISEGKNIPASVRVWSEALYAINRESLGFSDDRNLRLFEDAVKVSREAHLPTEETSTVLTMYGEDLSVRGKNEQAEPILRQALAIYEKDPLALCEKAEIEAWLGNLRHAVGDDEGSLERYRQAYDGYVVCSGPEGGLTLTEQAYMAGALLELGRPGEALAQVEAVLPVSRKVFGETSALIPTLFYASRAYDETGHWDQALIAAQEMMKIEDGHAAPNSRRLGEAEWMMAEALAGEQRYGEALPYAERAEAMLNNNPVTPAAKKMGTHVHDLHTAIEAKVAAER